MPADAAADRSDSEHNDARADSATLDATNGDDGSELSDGSRESAADATNGESTLTAVSPSFAPNNTTTLLTLLGTNFRPGISVTVGGQRCTDVEIVSATELRCRAPVAIAICGAQDVTAQNSDAASPSILPGAFEWRPATVEWSPSRMFAADRGPLGLAAADVNNDGFIDLATANNTASNLTLIYGRADGMQGTSITPLASSFNASNVLFADMNNDRLLDVVGLYSNDNGAVSISLNSSRGFDPLASEVSSISIRSITTPRRFVAGDIDRDGNVDLAIGAVLATQFAIMRGNGMGRLEPATAVDVDRGANDLALVDVTRDGLLDLVAVTGANRLAIYSNLGSGRLGAPLTVEVGSSPSALAVADLDNDGYQDFVVANRADRTVFVLRGNAGGVPAMASSVAIPACDPSAMTLADIDRDGRRDVAIACNNEGKLLVLLANPDRISWTAQPTIDVLAPAGVVSFDINRDGLPDLLATNSTSNTVSIFEQRCH